MKRLLGLLFAGCILLTGPPAFTQRQPARVDSLVNLLRTAGREWNDYARPLIAIGEPAVPTLIEAATDPRLNQWNRRISVMTLNEIHSRQWVRPALAILFDRGEDPVLRNQVTAGLSGFDLSDVRDELWNVYREFSNEFQKLNIAFLLVTADTSLAYRSFRELYLTYDGFVQKTALQQLIRLRPQESTVWLLDGLQVDDWMTANVAMDSLVATRHFAPDALTAKAGISASRFHGTEIPDTVKPKKYFATDFTD